VGWNALRAVGDHHPPPSSLAIVVLVIAVAVRGIMSALKFRVGRRIGSGSLVADAWNDAIDILGAVVALIAVWLTARGDRFLAADHYGGFAVGVIVIATGVRVIRDATLELVDTMPDADRVAQLRGVAASVPGVAGVDKAFARKTGFTWHVDIHVEVDPAMTVAASHEIAGAVRRRVRSEVRWVADVLVHVEPAGG
jgi:cation diffusion facilitator family transporter